VTGNYSNSLQLDLTSSVTGTTYSSSNPNVVTVDPQGNVQAVAFGTATVTAQNSGLKTFATFVVGDPTSPLPPEDVPKGINPYFHFELQLQPFGRSSSSMFMQG
jgi:hypothetical protein